MNLILRFWFACPSPSFISFKDTQHVQQRLYTVNTAHHNDILLRRCCIICIRNKNQTNEMSGERQQVATLFRNPCPCCAMASCKKICTTMLCSKTALAQFNDHQFQIIDGLRKVKHALSMQFKPRFFRGIKHNYAMGFRPWFSRSQN